ncbi:Vegetative incompatibility protein HET-E-1 [Fusarium austroafricanum]|uniref:Vegetative incompatibility protein HET-E-1 n=1 Tax=Fusarium austroafricanum TaxID=2364996 RepID=A0A8H4NVQ0_9HYPO|nr:Vegetative incompatibility protein HET-E-1 [Fusarium austroafricanum]
MAVRKDKGTAEAQFQQILEDASKVHSDSKEKYKLGDFLNPPINNVQDLIALVGKQNDQFTKFREKRQNIFSAMSACLTPVEVIGEVVSGAAKESFAPAEGIFGAVALLINAARDVSSAYDTIVELFEVLRDFTSRLDVYVQYKMGTALRNKVVVILAHLFEVFVLAAKEIRRGRIKAYFKTLIGMGTPVQEALQRLKDLNIGEERQVLADTYGGVNKLNLTTEGMATKLDQMNATMNQIRSEGRERTIAAHQDKLKEILDPSPFPEDFFNMFNKSRAESTGDWILTDGGFKAWLNKETNFLWITGAAGTGKSYLTTKLISWSTENIPRLAYFYFRDNNPETRSVLQALRDLAYQLSESDPFYAKQLLKNLRSIDEIRTIPSAYRKLFVEPFQQDDQQKIIYIFLDGIDEADSVGIDELLEQLGTDNERPEHISFQVALIGRTYMNEKVTYSLDPDNRGTQVITTLHVTPDRNADDVKLYIENSVWHLRNLSRTPPDFRQKIIDAMIKQADGLFILAKFMLEDISRKRHPQSILTSLQSYPKEINGIIAQTLKNLSETLYEDQTRDLNEMLQWAACAEEVLSLEQLEAVLIMRFGDPPFHLEETLRGQYACFFELEREDGLTTDDLIREHEKQQRIKNGDFGSGRRSSSASRPGSGRSGSPKSPTILGRQVDLGRNLSPQRRVSPIAGLSPVRGSPGRGVSPAANSDLFDPMSEMDFRSSKTHTWITFFHSSIKEFFSTENSAKFGSGVGFDPLISRIHILKTCLSIFTDKAAFDKYRLSASGHESIKQYAAWYWQEHLAVLDPATVPGPEKKVLGEYVYKMLTDDNIILDWTLMYEKNDEGLDVLTDPNMKGLKRWMGDPDVLASLSPEAREWASKGVKESPGIFKPIGDLYARAWLSEDFKKYVPTLFCFKIVQSIAFMQEGLSWSDCNTHWIDIPVEKRIAKAGEWAKIPESAHWHRRFGSTYLTNGMHNKALEHYNSALALDNNSVETRGRIAYCLSRDGRFKEALEQTLKCEAIEEESIASGKLDEQALKSCKWRLYKDHILIACCYEELNKVDPALEYFLKSMKSAKDVGLDRKECKEYFEPELGYLELLATENRHEVVIQFLKQLHEQVTDAEHKRTRLVDFLLEFHNKPLVIDWIPKAASKVGETEFVYDCLQLTIDVATLIRDPLKALYLRLSLGTTYTYSRDIDDAQDLFEGITQLGYRPRGNVPTRQAYALAFQKLASLYKERILHAGLNTPEANTWLEDLEKVKQKQSRHQNFDMPIEMVGSDVNIAAIYMILFNRLLGRSSNTDRDLRQLINDSLDILSDDDVQNDEYALDNLLGLFIAADDIDNALALSQSMRKVDPRVLASTPEDSPVLQRMEPKLPEIQTMRQNCAQCLDLIPPSDEFYICEYCMETIKLPSTTAKAKEWIDNNHQISRTEDFTMLDFLSPRKLLTQLTLSAGLVAAQLQTITNFGPTYNTQLTMQAYIPNNLPSSPAVMLAGIQLHACGGNGPGYFQATKYRSLADSRGVILIFPSSQKDFNCWDVASTKTLKHDGQGDSQVLVSMVDYVIKTYKADPKKVFVTGTSSGCMMTNVLAATYPDRFAAATCYSGVAAGCMAGSPGSSPISSDRVCSDGKIIKTGQQWASQVRSMYPGYSGSYPRFKTWHGTADNLVFYQNFLEQIKEWSTIHGVSFTRNETSTPQSGYTTMIYGDGTKFVAVSAAGVGHVVPTNENLDFKWFGLN